MRKSTTHFEQVPLDVVKNIGCRGEQGQRGAARKASPTERGALFTEVNGYFDDISKEVKVQMKGMSQIRLRVDELRAKVKKLSDWPQG